MREDCIRTDLLQPDSQPEAAGPPTVTAWCSLADLWYSSEHKVNLWRKLLPPPETQTLARSPASLKFKQAKKDDRKVVSLHRRVRSLPNLQ